MISQDNDNDVNDDDTDDNGNSDGEDKDKKIIQERLYPHNALWDFLITLEHVIVILGALECDAIVARNNEIR